MSNVNVDVDMCWWFVGLNARGEMGMPSLQRVNAIHLLNMFEMAFWVFFSRSIRSVVYYIRTTDSTRRFRFYYHFMLVVRRSHLFAPPCRTKSNRTYSKWNDVTATIWQRSEHHRPTIIQMANKRERKTKLLTTTDTHFVFRDSG